MKVYTKTGDGGTTSLVGGERVSKADPRVEAYGTVDELSAHIAMLADLMRVSGGFDGIVELFGQVQKELMVVEAILATGAGGGKKTVSLSADAMERLEGQIDALSEGLPALRGFVLPGGHPVASQSHVCRTVCRRAERAAVRAAELHPVPPEVGGYLNRLSDLLYVVGRKAVEILSIKETYWMP